MRKRVLLFAFFASCVVAYAFAQQPASSVIRRARVLAPDQLQLTLARPLQNLDATNFRLTGSSAPDIPLPIRSVVAQPGDRILLTASTRLNPAGSYRIEIHDPPAADEIHPPLWQVMLMVVLSSALINNFVFTRYLGLCIFFGVSKKRDTSVGMGITFTIVMVLSAMLSWALFTLVMLPLKLKFLQVLVFIGVVAFLVQALDTILKKTHRSLHQRFGVYLVLITTNCIILAVPLLNAAANSGPAESFALALGSGLGFALALFLMSCAREKLEFARVPAPLQGLPVAFALAGLFALAFMGFSGLDLLR